MTLLSFVTLLLLTALIDNSASFSYVVRLKFYKRLNFLSF